MQKFLMGVLLVLLSMASGIKSAQGTPDSEQQLATSLRLLAEASGQESFIDQLSAAIGKEHLNLLDPERNIYQIDVLSQGGNISLTCAVQASRNALLLPDVISAVGRESSTLYAHLVDAAQFENFMLFVSRLWKMLFEDAFKRAGEEHYTTMAKTIDLYERERDWVGIINFWHARGKPVDPVGIMKNIGMAIASAKKEGLDWGGLGVSSQAVERAADVNIVAMNGEFLDALSSKKTEKHFEDFVDSNQFFAGETHIESYIVMGGKHASVLVVYRIGNTIYNVYADSLGSFGWNSPVTNKAMNIIVDFWREAARKRSK